MKKAVVLLLIFIGTIYAESMHATYKVEYGIFGKMGVSDAYLTKENGRYKIKMVAKATGLAKVLSGGRVEIYESEGVVFNGRLIPEVFRKDIKRSGKRRVKIYRFDHGYQRVTYREKKYRDGKLESESNDTLPYYANDDILSLYFNTPMIIGDCTKPFDSFLKAVGAEKKTGKVRIETITGKQKEKMKASLGEASCYLKVTVYQKLFGSKGGELYLSLRSDNVVKKALLKDVVMFGDIRGKLIHFESKK
ncbi:DUF3108 domain-containing protein [Hydrogenimonas cancrithermarum]|uniref:DUF3108 domain-containing protein n=1 Tax=Hydrogenimonas cancrithermarum TaxID=2993563 RepID=A0ABM8FMB4_9BACT|nr:DUF3108 domain-containing protein [Hydrogenimonas cancrithermarum]BDY13487.1 hypothetical protein HCR_17990 [Hydrogenimonas cancrithermarum]